MYTAAAVHGHYSRPVPIIDQLVTAVRLDNSLDPSLRKRLKLVYMTQLTKLQYINITGPSNGAGSVPEILLLPLTWILSNAHSIITVWSLL